MASAKLAATLAAVAISNCGDPAQSAPAPTVPVHQPDFSCLHAFDTSCQNTAEVTIGGGMLSDASTHDSGDGGWGTMGSYRGLIGAVTVSGPDGQVSCDFTATLDIGTEMNGGVAIVTSASDVVFEPGCPLDCAWFFPGDGRFDDTQGRFTLQPFEGVWSLQLGAWAPEAPYGPEWLATAPASTTLGAEATLDEPVAVVASGWQAPMQAPGIDIAPTCP